MQHYDDRIGPLALLVGTWQGSGEGVYPTIETFGYTEQITFTDPVVKPFVAYAQRTEHATEGRPLHTEAGYLRWAAGAPEWVLASPTGVTEVHTGTVEQGEVTTFHFRTSSVAATATAKPVASVERVLHVRGDELTYELFMGAVGRPHQIHLRATLRRAGT
jgi:hypothetical protein